MIRFTTEREKAKRASKLLEPEDNPPAPNRSAASLKTVFVGGQKTKISKKRKPRAGK